MGTRRRRPLPLPLSHTHTHPSLPPPHHKQEELTQLEALIDAIKVMGPGAARREGLLKLSSEMITGAPRTARFANEHGARELLLKALDGALKRGDEALMDAISAAVAEESRCADTEETVVGRTS